MIVTRTDIERGSDDDILASIKAMEDQGWGVRAMVPTSSSTWVAGEGQRQDAYVTGFYVTYERAA